jgi:hypothetical protein
MSKILPGPFRQSGFSTVKVDPLVSNLEPHYVKRKLEGWTGCNLLGERTISLIVPVLYKHEYRDTHFSLSGLHKLFHQARKSLGGPVMAS